jgi:hypothetical protein
LSPSPTHRNPDASRPLPVSQPPTLNACKRYSAKKFIKFFQKNETPPPADTKPQVSAIKTTRLVQIFVFDTFCFQSFNAAEIGVHFIIQLLESGVSRIAMPWDSSTRANQVWPLADPGRASSGFPFPAVLWAQAFGIHAFGLHLNEEEQEMMEHMRAFRAFMHEMQAFTATFDLPPPDPIFATLPDMHEQPAESSATRSGEDSSTHSTDSRGPPAVAAANSKKQHRDRIADERPESEKNWGWLWSRAAAAGFGSENRLWTFLQ